jgi:hypothetical protein
VTPRPPAGRSAAPSLWAALLLAAWAAPASAAVRLRASVQPSETTVGDPVTLTIEAAVPEGTQVSAPEGPWDPFELVSAEAAPPRGGAEPTHVFTYRLAAFATGVSTIPAAAVRYREPGGEEREIRTEEVPVTVRSVLGPDAADIRDIKGPEPTSNAAPWTAALLSAAAAGAAYALWRRKRSRAAAAAEAARVPPHEAALAALDALERDLSLPGKDFHTRLADVLRAYLEGRYAVPALDRTTAEIFQECRRSGLDTSVCGQVRDVLESSDLSKFAKREPSDDDKLRDLRAARDLVARTRPREEVLAAAS